MSKLIRKGVFETNSSSCHSITISDDNKLNDIPVPNMEGVIDIWPQTFGWEVHQYDDFDSKASYIAIYCRDWSGDNSEKHFEIFEDCIKEVSQCNKIIYNNDMMKYEIGTYTNSDGEQITYKDYGFGAGIDHQSVENNDLDYLFEDPEKLKLFLFSNDSCLETDNDNY